MAYVQLQGRAGHGAHAIVDDDDLQKVSAFKWYLNIYGYAVATPSQKSMSNRKVIFMHRLIAKTPVGKQTDHINHDKLDNRKQNLRIVRKNENMQNRSKNKATCSSIYKGVHWHSIGKKWRAHIRVNGKELHIGMFDNERHAAMAYDLWATFFWPEFAKTNFKLAA